MLCICVLRSGSPLLPCVLQLTFNKKGFTDNISFPYLRDGQVIMEIVMEKRHPPRPPEPAASVGLSDYIWRLLQDCWSYEASDRPSMQYVIRNLGKASCLCG